MKKFYLEAVVFICGAVIMILELVGSRIMAPFVGTSTVVWTSLIGVILACISAGYYWGGRQADILATPAILARIIFWAGMLVAVAALIKTPVLTVVTAFISDIKISASVGTFILFGPASFVLGMVAPFAAKLKINVLATAGSTVGTLYALSTVGSITGTFLAGFWLMNYLGSTKILYVLALVLLLVSLGILGIAWSRKHMGAMASIVLIGVVGQYAHTTAATQLEIIETDSAYQHIQIFNTINNKDKRPIKVLKTDVFGSQSAQYLDSDELVFAYTNYFNLVEFIQPNLNHALLIGAGAYSYPKFFLKKFPTTQLDVVEMDPKLTELARTHFGLQADPRLHIFHQDGRTFLNQGTKKYDAIFIDAFNSLTPPFQLTTREAVQKIFEQVSENGVVLVNLISALEGKDSAFLQAEYATYASIFPHLELFAVDNFTAPQRADNVLLVAFKGNQIPDWKTVPKQYSAFVAHRWLKPIVPGKILTDEFAPVEKYLSGVYQR